MLDISIMMAPLAAFSIGLCAVPAVRRIAVAWRFLDNPDRWRKLQSTPIALGGGIAVWLATWAGWGVGLLGPAPAAGVDGGAQWELAALALATFLVLALGIVDDRFGLRGRHKLAGQAVAAVVLVVLGLRIDAWSGFGVTVRLGLLAYPVTVFWILLVVNAYNLVDGMDGFCGGLGLIASLAIAFLAYRSGHVEDAMVALALAGALAAFLRYNLPPARIYLGDAGSMSIGMALAALSVRSCATGPGGAVSLMPVIALLTLPLVDLGTAIGRRWLLGRSIFTPDREHLHHCLANRFGGTQTALVVAGSLATLGAAGAVLTTIYGMGDSMACLVIALAIGLLVCTNSFGATELRILLFRIKVAVAPLLKGLSARGMGIDQECHLHGTRDWAAVWDDLVREAEASAVWRLELSIDMAAAGEVYYGHWSLPMAIEDEPHWSVVHVLHAGGKSAGMISVAGTVNASGSPYLDKVEKLVRVVEDRLLPENARLSPPGAAPLSNVNLTVTSALT